MPSDLIIRLHTFVLRILFRLVKKSKKSKLTKNFMYTLVYGLNLNNKTIFSNLKRAFPEKTKKQLVEINKAFIQKHLDYLADFLNSPEITKEALGNSLKITNFEYYEDAIKQGNGVIFAAGHFGNFFLACSLVPMIVNNKMIVVFDMEFAPILKKAVKEIITPRGIEIVLRKEWRKGFDFLKQNHVLSLAVDQADGNHSFVDVQFFGNTIKYPIGPPLISYKSSAPIIPCFMFAEDDGYEFVFEKPIIPDPKQDLQIYIQATMQTIATLLENYIREYPQQYFWLLRL